MKKGDTLLQIENLSVSMKAGKTLVPAVRGVTLSLKRNGCTGVIGESGCGKSLTCQAVLGLLEPKKWSVTGVVSLEGEEIPIKDDRSMEHFRGKKLALVAQNPMAAFDPRMTMGAHFLEGHPRREWDSIRKNACKRLARMGIREPESLWNRYSFELSGGQLQRVLLALVLGLSPRVLLADEPTTALDRTTEKELLRIFADCQNREGISILLVSHDLDVISRMADTVYVMYAGQILEWGEKEAVLGNPLHPYTGGLLRSRPGFSKERLKAISGYPPRLGEIPGPGCPFAPRCPLAKEVCKKEQDLREITPGHFSRCSCFCGQWEEKYGRNPFGSE